MPAKLHSNFTHNALKLPSICACFPFVFHFFHFLCFSTNCPTITAVCVAKLHSNCLQFVHVCHLFFIFSFCHVFHKLSHNHSCASRNYIITFVQTAVKSHVKTAKRTIPHAINRLCPIMDMHLSTCRRSEAVVLYLCVTSCR